MFVRQILVAKGRNVIAISTDAKIADVVTLLNQHQIGAVMVTDANSAPKGIISERDLAIGLANHGSNVLDQRVDQLMTKDLIVCTPEDTVQRLMQIMTSHRIRHLPVLDKGEMVGIISVGDVVKSRLDELEAEASELQQYIAGR